MRWLAVLAVACSPRAHHVRPRSWAPVAIREVELLPAPGGLPCGVVLEPGYPLPATVASWLHVHQDHPIRIDGWVPASARGVLWQERLLAIGDGVRADAAVVVRDAPDPDAAIIAVLDARVSAAIHGEVGTWAPIEAVAGRVHVTGWAIVPPPPSVRTFDFDGDVIEGDLVRPEGIRD